MRHVYTVLESIIYSLYVYEQNIVRLQFFYSIPIFFLAEPQIKSP